MAWLSENWFWVIILILFVVLHLFGHGGMHGGHGHGQHTEEDKPGKSEHQQH